MLAEVEEQESNNHVTEQGQSTDNDNEREITSPHPQNSAVEKSQ